MEAGPEDQPRSEEDQAQPWLRDTSGSPGNMACLSLFWEQIPAYSNRVTMCTELALSLGLSFQRLPSPSQALVSFRGGLSRDEC